MTERDSIQNDRVQEANDLINENDNEQEIRTVIRVEDKELENIFNQILLDMEYCTMLELHPREKLPKLKLTPDIAESANRILDEYLHGDENIPEITDKVYAIRKAIAIKSGIVQKQANYRRKYKLSNGIRRERKLKPEIKRLRQQIARTSNGIYQITQKRKATAKEKGLMNELKKLMCGVDPTTRMFKEYKESWIDKLRYKKIKLQKLFERGRRIMDNANFERDQKNFFKKVEGETEHVGQIQEMEKFLKFWGDICEKDDRAPEMPWIESVSDHLRDKITNVKELNIIEKTFEKETKKRKNWTAPGLDDIQNFWWKRLKPARRQLKRAFEQVKDNNKLIPVWWP